MLFGVDEGEEFNLKDLLKKSLNEWVDVVVDKNEEIILVLRSGDLSEETDQNLVNFTKNPAS